MTDLHARPLTPQAFAPFGDVLEAAGEPDRLINQGLCGRFHDRARLELIGGPRRISIFRPSPDAPYARDGRTAPLGPQAFPR
jgi:ureidoglycolate lyase